MTDVIEADEEDITIFRRHIDELNYRNNFLRTRLSDVPALSIAIEQNMAKIENHQAEIDAFEGYRRVARLRLPQCRRELANVLEQIYDETDTILLSLDPDGLLPPFHDDDGSLRDDIVMPRELTSALRLAASGHRHVRTAKSKLEKSRRGFSRASTLARTRRTLGGRNDWKTRKSRTQKALFQDQYEYDLLCMRQQEFEDDLVENAIVDFLLEYALIAPLGILSDTSSVEDVELLDKDDEDSTPHDATADYRAAEFDQWIEDRRKVALAERLLKGTRYEHAQALGSFLFDYPQCSKLDFDARHMYGNNVSFKALEKHMIATERRLTSAYDETRRKATAAGGKDWLWSPTWAASTSDVAPSQASSQRHHMRPATVQNRERTVRRWNRQVIRAQLGKANNPEEQMNDWDDETRFIGMDHLRSPLPEEGPMGAPASTLSDHGFRVRIDRHKADRKRLRHFLEVLRMEDMRG